MTESTVQGETALAFTTDDRIFLGEGLFETLKVEKGIPCYAYAHWQRLSDSAQQLGIHFEISYEDWLHRLLETIKLDNLQDGGIKAILSGGSAPRGLTTQGRNSQLMLQTFTYGAHTKPLRLISSSWLRDALNPVYRVKSVNYLEAILARREALSLGADDALFFNLHHHATETTCANLFLIHNQCVLTPPLEDGVLPGITRSRVFKSAEQHQICCMEVSLTKERIITADAVFVTNALQGIQPVCSLDGVSFAVNNPLIKHLKCALGEASSV